MRRLKQLNSADLDKAGVNVNLSEILSGLRWPAAISGNGGALF